MNSPPGRCARSPTSPTATATSSCPCASDLRSSTTTWFLGECRYRPSLGLFLLPLSYCFFNLGNVYSLFLQEFLDGFYKQLILVRFAPGLLPSIQCKLMETNLQRRGQLR